MAPFLIQGLEDCIIQSLLLNFNKQNRFILFSICTIDNWLLLLRDIKKNSSLNQSKSIFAPKFSIKGSNFTTTGYHISLLFQFFKIWFQFFKIWFQFFKMLTNPKSKSKSKSRLLIGFSLKSDFPTTRPPTRESFKKAR